MLSSRLIAVSDDAVRDCIRDSTQDGEHLIVCGLASRSGFEVFSHDLSVAILDHAVARWHKGSGTAEEQATGIFDTCRDYLTKETTDRDDPPHAWISILWPCRESGAVRVWSTGGDKIWLLDGSSVGTVIEPAIQMVQDAPGGSARPILLGGIRPGTLPLESTFQRSTWFIRRRARIVVANYFAARSIASDALVRASAIDDIVSAANAVSDLLSRQTKDRGLRGLALVELTPESERTV